MSGCSARPGAATMQAAAQSIARPVRIISDLLMRAYRSISAAHTEPGGDTGRSLNAIPERVSDWPRNRTSRKLLRDLIRLYFHKLTCDGAFLDSVKPGKYGPRGLKGGGTAAISPKRRGCRQHGRRRTQAR